MSGSCSWRDRSATGAAILLGVLLLVTGACLFDDHAPGSLEFCLTVVASAGLRSMVTTLPLAGWATPLLLIPILLVPLRGLAPPPKLVSPV